MNATSALERTSGSRRRTRAMLAIAVLAGSLLTIVGPSMPASAFFHPMPTPTGPHHRHIERNPSAEAVSLLSAKQKTAIAKWSGTSRRLGGVRCTSNCVDPRVVYGSTAGPDRRASVATAGTTWCSWIEGWVYTTNLTGAKVWQFTVHTDYCWNQGTGTVVSHHTAAHPTVYTWASVLGWDYAGTTEVSSWKPFGNNTAVRTYAQGHFDYCPPRIWCVQTKYPYIYLDVYGTGDRMMSGWGA
jgi:hypothetical protein